MAATNEMSDSEHFSPYRADGKLVDILCLDYYLYIILTKGF